MKKTLIAAFALVAGGALTTATAAKKDKKDKKADTKVEAVKLDTKADTLSYAAGMSRTEGLMPYLKQSFGIEEKDMADFIAGYEAYVNSGRDAKAVAYAAGQQIAQMANERMLPYLNKEFKESSDSVSAKFFNKGFVASLKKDNSVLADSVAKPYFENAVKANIEAMNMKNKKWEDDFTPIDPDGCDIDQVTTKAYLHHLFKAQEYLALQIASIHNLSFYLRLVGDARRHITAGDYATWMKSVIDNMQRRI